MSNNLTGRITDFELVCDGSNPSSTTFDTFKLKNNEHLSDNNYYTFNNLLGVKN